MDLEDKILLKSQIYEINKDLIELNNILSDLQSDMSESLLINGEIICKESFIELKDETEDMIRQISNDIIPRI